MIYRQFYQSPIGELCLLASDCGLLGVYFVGQKYYERGYDSVEIVEQPTPILDVTRDWLYRYFAGDNPTVSDLVLAPSGTTFQHNVWSVLRAISYGETRTYGQIANELGYKSARAIGGAVGKNPLSIIIPCHRIIGSDGSLTGYAGGVDRKIWLLNQEQALYKK